MRLVTMKDYFFVIFYEKNIPKTLFEHGVNSNTLIVHIHIQYSLYKTSHSQESIQNIISIQFAEKYCVV